ncbi:MULTISPECIES: phosphate ABC transporter substrate-binding protein [Aminobacterium]|uniref:phosphate ABC transporter substrate-binding protein n=1 Tax=Aminobacterium TaxID=81466 RepID=UPI000B187795|nr:phosphate ABC transporter substrate-binding protein [Aminobacterium sp. EBM-42]MDD2378959.1 phosphate ABC transporter substrate-binding protein [Aminobacterium colombiense]MDD3767492.1 phosphate ABC transporter substrate-binding protein [Aminobacterium colombiense]MDD4265596.1 phosphate ABC transporter substrate-binding protein [Aminobacterium colombiense]NLK30595.1 phosphate ABC transporter substrate-binding protein [Aminobacterium colombiense]
MHRFFRFLFTSIMIMSFVIAGNQLAVAADGQIFFKGSSTLAPVISQVAQQFMEKYGTWNKIDASLPDAKIEIFVSGGGSGEGVKAVLDGTSNFGMTARTVKEEEKKAIGDYHEFHIGTDALTISVNPDNKVCQVKPNLTKDELVKIFSGEYRTWNNLDPALAKEEIVVVIRDIGGGAHEVFQKSIMKKVDVTPSAIQSPSMGALVTKVIENKNAIGYASFGMVNVHEGEIIPLKVDGVEPTVENILDGTYYVSRPLLVVKKGNMSPIEKAFIDELLSAEGMKIVEQMGFVPAK